jgi:exonuclease VII large subunit
VAHLVESIAQRVQMQVEAERSDIARLMETVSFSAQSRLGAAGTEIDRVKTDIGRDIGRMAATACDELDHAIGLIEKSAMAMADGAQKDIEYFARIVVGMGPHSTLQRGFAILRDPADKPVTSREAAITLDTFEIELRDGRLKVKNQDRSGEDQP